MAQVFGKTVLGVAASLLAVGFAPAQEEDPIRQAEIKLRTNQKEEALAILQGLIDEDPSNERAFELWRTARAEAFALFLAEGGDYAKIVNDLMARARRGRVELSRDDSSIEEAVAAALDGDDIEAQQAGLSKLAGQHGEFGVPPLMAILASGDTGEVQTHAIFALTKIGRRAVLPLMEGLKSENAGLRSNLAAALLHIGDSRAAPALANLLENDSSDDVRHVARSALERMKVPAGGSAADMFATQSRGYLISGGTGGSESAPVVWKLDGDTVVPQDVPAPLYHLELAKMRALDALRIDPSHSASKVLLARSYLAEVATIKDRAESGDDSVSTEAIGPLRMVALATGTEALRTALLDSLAENQAGVAIEAIEALATSEPRRGLQSSPLIRALDDPNTRVRYAAALALTRASRGTDVPQAGKVVAALSNAVQEESLRFIKVVDPSPQAGVAAAAADRNRGFAVDAVGTGEQAVADVFSFPNYDAIIVNDTLPDHTATHVISLIRKHAPNSKIIGVSLSEDGSPIEDKVDAVISGSLSAENLMEKVNEVLEEMDVRRQRADAVAVAASEALLDLAEGDTDVSGALASLSGQLNRAESVAIPAARTIGESGVIDNVAALEGALTSDSASVDLKVAAADAIGSILGRAGQMPEGLFDRLLAIAADADSDIALRSAVANALGRASLDPGSIVKLAETLGSIASSNSDG